MIGFFAIHSKLKTVAPFAARPFAPYFLKPKSMQKAYRDFTAQRYALGSLQCSILSGAAELAALRHAASLFLTEFPRFGGSHAQQSQKHKRNQHPKQVDADTGGWVRFDWSRLMMGLR